VACEFAHFVFGPAVVVCGLGVVVGRIEEHEVLGVIVVLKNSPIIEGLDQDALHAAGEFADGIHEGIS